MHKTNNHERTEASDYLGSFVVKRKGNIMLQKRFALDIARVDWVLCDKLNLELNFKNIRLCYWIKIKKYV